MDKLLLNLETFKGPTYLRIARAIEIKIKTNVLNLGDKLPSIRSLAKSLGCHRHTVMNAYQELLAQGIVQSYERSSYLVSENLPADLTQVDHPLIKNISLIKLGHSLPDTRFFPVQEYRSYLTYALKKRGGDILNYAPAEGDPRYLETLKLYLKQTRDLVPGGLLVTHGSQEAIFLILSTLVRPGDIVALDEFCYPPVKKILQHIGATIWPIRIMPDGPDLQQLEKKLQTSPDRPKIFYTTPLHQYPTTAVMSHEKRRYLLKLSDKYDFYILEDDYDHEFHYRSRPLRPLRAMDENGRVIYVGTMSKVLFPSIRLGHMQMDESLFHQFKEKKELITRQSDGTVQEAVGTWLRDGGVDRHIRKMKRIYKKRYEFLEHELINLHQRGIELKWNDPGGGMAFWVKFSVSTRQLCKRAVDQGLSLTPQEHFHLQGFDGPYLRLGFSQFDEKQLSLAIEKLHKTLITFQ